MDLAVANEAYTAQALTRRGVKRVVHFHCDHFEPYDVDGSGTRIGLGHIEYWLAELKQFPWAHPTLFWSSQSVVFRQGDTEPCWSSRVSTDREILSLLKTSGHSIQLHVHHESWKETPEINSEHMRRILSISELMAWPWPTHPRDRVAA